MLEPGDCQIVKILPQISATFQISNQLQLSFLTTT